MVCVLCILDCGIFYLVMAEPFRVYRKQNWSCTWKDLLGGAGGGGGHKKKKTEFEIIFCGIFCTGKFLTQF